MDTFELTEHGRRKLAEMGFDVTPDVERDAGWVPAETTAGHCQGCGAKMGRVSRMLGYRERCHGCTPPSCHGYY